MKKKISYTASFRDRKGEWVTLGEIIANSMMMARNMASRKTHRSLGNYYKTHIVKVGKRVYEYDHGAICIERG